ncbi:MAG: TIGR00730 family Rossman fold protein [Alphaproteobacteria bacterium]
MASRSVPHQTMHERKQIMFDRSDAFVIMPGGIGTLEETFEMLTWRQLKRHDKPIIVVNIGNHWAPFVTLIDHIVREGAGAEIADLITVVPAAKDVIPAIKGCLAPVAPEPLAEHLEQM